MAQQQSRINLDLLSQTLPRQHYEEQYSQAPDVACCVVSLPLEHLRSHEVGRVARGHEKAVLGPQLLGEAKVADPDAAGVARGVGVKDVGGFEVAVDHAVLVEVLDHADNLVEDSPTVFENVIIGSFVSCTGYLITVVHNNDVCKHNYLASFSEKNFCLAILSSSSPPRMKSKT